ncbi:MAG: CRISPR system precrRNA processing endoribonuclease RAMP protein Cas6, partial [Thermodesulfobacteriota bacterium]|nr:CRISPR system precrRNA processing endoribonuclease RAMP protein Cas6 [Thermodesulfobacteriota bacterium]
KYIFSCKFNNTAILPEYKGSTFRGVLGHSLKKVVCTLKKQDCKDCLLRSQCLYPRVFELSSWNNTDNTKTRVVSPPHPYVIEPDDNSTKTHFQKGDTFDFALLLFGDINKSLPYFIYAFDQVGNVGIGKRINGKRAGFSLIKVISDNKIVYDAQDTKIKDWDYARDLALDTASRPSETHLNLNLATPLRVKHENRLNADLPFHILIRTALRRISSLFEYYGQGEPVLDYPGLVQRAGAVETASSTLTWFDWKRYSNRQDRSMLMGGMTGDITYNGELGEYMEVLRLCELLHLGKQTTFGLGKIKVGQQ